MAHAEPTPHASSNDLAGPDHRGGVHAVRSGERLGLKVRRFFTREGQHPYDELEWELRDAIIKNWRDGTISFEQRGVEFPASWSMNATTIVAQKYFRGPLGSPERERSVKQMIDRVADTITAWGTKDGYFTDERSSQVFNLELKHVLVNQKAAFNSPVWFNVGVEGKPQSSACFILSVEDTMSSILNWYVEEGTIFKGGSGSGVNLSTIRSSKEQLSGGGQPSGPVSFMRGADASAGTIKSGGKTRRAAKMVVLNADHPDIEEFIWCKTREERKSRVLREAGFDMDLDSPDYASIQYQNANNSVRVTDELMRAWERDEEYDLRAVTTGEVLERKRARDVMRQIAQAAWECADPGMQYDTTINRWHTCPESGRINASNPCFPGDAVVHTDKGLIRFDQLVGRVNAGETFEVYTHDATNPDQPGERVELTSPDAFMISGRNEITKLTFSNGMQLRCTPNHRIWTTNRGYVEAKGLTAEDRVKALNLPTPTLQADWKLPVSTTVTSYVSKGDHSAEIRLPEKWTPKFAHYLGWLVGDGCIADNIVSTIYGSQEEQQYVLPIHRELAAWMNGGREPKPSVQPNGTVQLRQSRRAIARFLEALGVSTARASEKVVPWSIMQAPPEVVAAFLRGLFDADGCVYEARASRYVGLASTSNELLRGVQLLLSTLGIFSRIYRIAEGGGRKFSYAPADGTTADYESKPLFDLRIANRSVQRFAEQVDMAVPSKAEKLQGLLRHRRYKTDETVRLVERKFDGFALTYNLSEPRNHSYIVNGIVIRNCSEYMHLDNSACNLASLNLKKFYDYEADRFDVEAYKRAIEIMITAQEILVGNSSYPTEKIRDNAIAFRELGLGYANLGGLLMSLGLPYDSDQGRAWCGALTALMTGQAYRTSAEIAKVTGPFSGYGRNAHAMLNVIRMHGDEAEKIDPRPVPGELLGAAKQAWKEAYELGSRYGFRNSQATVLAPTGTISFLMDCDTTGIEPDLGLVKTKKLVGGGSMSIVNQTVPQALHKLGYNEEQIEAVVAHIDEHKTILGAPALRQEHLSVFSCAMGDNPIHYMGHVKMMAAAQPFVSGAISKTVNMPEDVTVEDVEQLLYDAWKLGIKAIAIYRDNCKVAQPLAVTKAEKAGLGGGGGTVEVTAGMVRRKLPKQRPSQTISFRVADAEGYLTCGEYPGDGLGEIFMKLGKQGSTLSGVMDAFAISVSLGLQYGVPLEAYVSKFMNMRFEPAGMTDDEEIRFATSIVDYIARKLAIEYLPPDKRAELGIYTLEERQVGLDTEPPHLRTGLPELPASSPRAPARGPSSAPADADAPLCYACGIRMKRAGSCHVCEQCGTTSGCS